MSEDFLSEDEIKNIFESMSATGLSVEEAMDRFEELSYLLNLQPYDHST